MSGRSLTPVEIDIKSIGYYDKAFSPRIGLVVQPLPWLSFYGSFTRSFGANNTAASGAALPPQKGEGWEGGAKAELFDRRLTASVRLFLYRQDQHHDDQPRRRQTTRC